MNVQFIKASVDTYIRVPRLNEEGISQLSGTQLSEIMDAFHDEVKFGKDNPIKNKIVNLAFVETFHEQGSWEFFGMKVLHQNPKMKCLVFVYI